MRNYTDEGTPKSYSRLVISSVNTYTFTKRKSVWSFSSMELLVASWHKNDSENWMGSPFGQNQTSSEKSHRPRQRLVHLWWGHDDGWEGSWLSDPSSVRWDPAGEISNVEGLCTNPRPNQNFRGCFGRHEGGPGVWLPMVRIWSAQAQRTSAELLRPGGAGSVYSGKYRPWLGHFSWSEYVSCSLPALPTVSLFLTRVSNIVLQIRLLSYGDSQRYRLGANHDQLPPNRACSYVYDPTRRNGAHNMTNYANAPNYIGSRERDLKKPDHYNISFLNWQGKISRYLSEVKDVDYKQCREHWDTLSKPQQCRFISNVASSVAPASSPVRKATIGAYASWLSIY